MPEYPNPINHDDYEYRNTFNPGHCRICDNYQQKHMMIFQLRPDSATSSWKAWVVAFDLDDAREEVQRYMRRYHYDELIIESVNTWVAHRAWDVDEWNRQVWLSNL